MNMIESKMCGDKLQSLNVVYSRVRNRFSSSHTTESKCGKTDCGLIFNADL